MGIATKGSSVITVHDAKYRWVVSGNDGFLDLVIETAEGHGQRLVIQLDYEMGQITPRFVRQLILTGLATGWTPSTRARQIYVRLIRKQLIPIEAL